MNYVKDHHLWSVAIDQEFPSVQTARHVKSDTESMLVTNIAWGSEGEHPSDRINCGLC